MPLKADRTDEMSTLNKYIRILKRLNYANVTAKLHTREATRFDGAQVGGQQAGIVEYYSSIRLSIDVPYSKSINVSCAGTNTSKLLAEREAVRLAVDYLSKHCISNGIHHINEGNEYNAVFKEVNRERNLLSSSNDFTHLPFFNEGYVGPGGIPQRNALYQPPSIQSRRRAYANNYQSSFQNFHGRRHYSRQSTSGGCEASVAADNFKGKKVDIDELHKIKEYASLNLAENSSVSQFDQEHADTLKLFESPKGFLGNLYNNIQVSTKSDVPLRNYKVQLTHNKEWRCTLQVTWPENSMFITTASSKKEAAKRAAILCLEWLQKLGKIDSQGRLKLLDKNDLTKENRKPLAEINVSESYVASAEQLINHFTASNLEDRLKTIFEEWKDGDLELCADFTKKEDISKQIPENLLMKRNKELYNRLCERERFVENSSVKLPVGAYRAKIIDLINNNQVVIVKGEPGCGKSTQVPQFIIDDYTEKMRATDCSIVCTQPRRISAITLAERIASERNEMVGDVIGYQVRLDSMKPRRDCSSILLCSTGIMLRKLLSNPGMEGISHIIIDEAHERDLNTDLLLLMTKRAAAINPNLKIIIMSATINPELFQNYFENSAVLHIPGFTYSVAAHFLDSNISKITGLKQSSQSKFEFPVIDVKAITALVAWIDRNKPPGAVLVFLPGWADISRLLKELSIFNKLLVLPVHSRLSHADQKKIFCTPPSGMRKVILATNIAETSITIDDVNYVIDSGAHKEERLQHGMLAIDNQWISQASAKQRRGRAGRVRPGECYHLYPKEKYESFDEFPVPEVCRARLETTVLTSKVFSGNEKAEAFLKQLPEPPRTEMIQDAVKKLQWAGALDEDENLTPLGTRISVFTTHPLISKALVHSYFFKCVDLMVSIGTVLSSDIELFRGVMGDKSIIRAAKQKYNPSSDHLAIALMFQEWQKYNVDATDYGYDIRGKRFAEKLGASNDAFRLIGKLRHLVGEHLYQCGLLDSIGDYDNAYSDCNAYSANNELLKGVLLSGLGNVLSSRNWDVKKGVLKNKNVVLTESGQRATISSESVNHKRTKFPSPFMTYFTEVRSEQQRSVTIRDTSIVSPLTLVLFQCATLNINKCVGTATDLNLKPDQVIISLVNKQSENSKKTLNIVCNERTANAIMRLRKIMWSIIGYLVRESDQPLNEEFHIEIMNFHEKFMSLLNKILLEQSVYTDQQDELQKRAFK